LHKTDAIHGAFVGLVIGGVLGALVGAMLVNYPPRGVSLEMVAILVAAVVGALLGVWVATMVGLQVPNSRLRQFESELQDGRVLLMLDVPSRRFDEVRDIIARKHPEAVDRGHEPTVPAFP
jgi:membrane protein DedA with SNARE-associated domain